MNGIIVSNTGPLIALSLVERLDILRRIFSRVVISQAVHEEILEGAQKGVGIKAYLRADWIEVHNVTAPQDVLLRNVLDSGEASVVQLSREIGSDYLLIDERKGRKIARSIYGIRVVGTARIIVEARKRGLVSDARKLINDMRAGGYWIHEDIVNRVLMECPD